MDSESGCLPLDYLQGHKDGLEWAAQLAEANHPETGDWLYDDPIELAKAIRKGPDMPPAQLAADSEPVAWMWHHFKQWHVTNDEERARDLAWDGVKVAPLYRHPQQPVVPGGWKMVPIDATREMIDAARRAEEDGYDAMHKAMLAAAPHDTPALNSVQSVVTVPGKWIPVSERMPEVGVKVLCFPAEDEPIHAVFNGQLWLQDVSWSGSEEPIDNVIPVTVTHWMPLPAGPQEVR
ncbi:TPA: DUF551 domain-containing protein [Klebsiella pneumoniae]